MHVCACQQGGSATEGFRLSCCFICIFFYIYTQYACIWKCVAKCKDSLSIISPVLILFRCNFRWIQSLPGVKVHLWGQSQFSAPVLSSLLVLGHLLFVNVIKPSVFCSSAKLKHNFCFSARIPSTAECSLKKFYFITLEKVQHFETILAFFIWFRTPGQERCMFCTSSH